MKRAISTLALILATGSVTAAQSQVPQTVRPISVSPDVVTHFDRFKPNPSTTTRLDFDLWDMMLKDMVYYTGPSLRQRIGKPDSQIGTRLTLGHVSPYRLEGNKVVFEAIFDDAKAIISEYVADLEDIGNRIDIASLPRNEQLAFWINLHNAIAIDEIAAIYPVKFPSRYTDDNGVAFHDIPRVTIDGVPLSLRNIREDIVYRNWDNPLVIYGFFHGDIGSPSIQRKAYTGANVSDTLRFSAEEFANSMRGVVVYGKNPNISRHYADAAPYFFPNLDQGYRAHMRSIANEDVAEDLLRGTNPVKVASYEDAVADLTFGDAQRSNIYNTSSFLSKIGTLGPNSPLVRALREQEEKFRRIRSGGLFGSVTIEDIETIDPSDFGKPGGPRTINIGPLATVPPEAPTQPTPSE